MPFFSVIIPTFNRKEFLRIALDSVLGQSFFDFEVIIIDDGSDDGTQELIAGYSDQRIQYFYQPNQGVSISRNRGLKETKGACIAFLDSDDRWVPEKLQRVYDTIAEFPEIKIFHTDEIWYRQGKILNQKKIHAKPSGFVYQKALLLCCISISTAVIKREVFDQIGYFDESLPACEDYDFWLRATHKYEVKLIPENLTLKDGGRPDQLSSQWGLDQYRVKALNKMIESGQLNEEECTLTQQERDKKEQIYRNGALKRGRVS